MAVKQKRIKCARCGERETVTKGERGPVSIYWDLCRDEVKREQAALRAQAYRQRKASYGGVRRPHPPGRAADFVGIPREDVGWLLDCSCPRLAASSCGAAGWEPYSV